VTEAEARAALATSLAVGKIERRIAAQPWETVAGGWRVPVSLKGWRFRLEPVAGGVRVVMSAVGGEPAAWIAAWVVPVRHGGARPWPYRRRGRDRLGDTLSVLMAASGIA
jgi:hypothetical protein